MILSRVAGFGYPWRACGSRAVPFLAVLLSSAFASAQTPVAETPVAEAPPVERPGLFRVGSFYLTPYLNIGSMGIDTNVFYTPTDRQTDFTASLGPGLELVRPIGRESRFRLDGGLDYLYFAKTDWQRKLNGHGSAESTSWGRRRGSSSRSGTRRPTAGPRTR